MQVDADEDNFEHDGDGRWRFHSFVEQLILDMFDPGQSFSFFRSRACSVVHILMIFCLKIHLQFGRFAMGV